MTNSYHEATKHTYLSVRSGARQLEWSKMPKTFKIYPNSFPLKRLELDNKTDRFIYLLGGITAKKVYPGVEYYLRTVPSAGALYPVEIYFQARDVERFKNGIYHFSPAENGVRLLYEIKDEEGVEFHLKDKRIIKGFLFLFSSVYFRSSWKYSSRAFRYTLLDTGHTLGALEASCYLYEHAFFILYDFDKKVLNEKFGFKDREFFLSGAKVGIPQKKEAKFFDLNLPFVDPTETFETNEVIQKSYLESLRLTGCKKEYRFPKFNFHKERFFETILNRRSIRKFSKLPIKSEEFEYIYQTMTEPIPSDCDEKVEIYYIVNKVSGMKQGLYKNKELLKEGDFSQIARYLCLEQALGGDSAVTFFLTSNGNNYQSLYQKAGIIGQRCYLSSEYLQIGCSGIGAYYDDDVKNFLHSDDMVLYALAIGK